MSLTYKQKQAIVELSQKRDTSAYESKDGYVIIKTERTSFSISNLFDLQRLFGERGLEFVLRA